MVIFQYIYIDEAVKDADLLSSIRASLYSELDFP